MARHIEIVRRSAKTRTEQFFDHAMRQMSYTVGLMRTKALFKAEARAQELEEEASEMAVAGNPARAGYLEYWAMRVRQHGAELG